MKTKMQRSKPTARRTRPPAVAVRPELLTAIGTAVQAYADRLASNRPDLPLAPDTVRVAAIREVLRIIAAGPERQPQRLTFTMPVGSGASRTISPEYAFAFDLTRGDVWWSIAMANNLTTEQTFARLLAVAAGAVSPEWTNPPPRRECQEEGA